MHNDDLVRSVRKGRRVKLVRQLACQGHGAGLSLEAFGRQTFALNFLSATTPGTALDTCSRCHGECGDQVDGRQIPF